MFHNWGVEKQTVVHIHTMEYYSEIKRSIDIFDNMNHLKCKFSVKETRVKGYIPYDSISMTW